MAQKNKGVWWRKYKWQLNAALKRGIPWNFSFEEWCDLWRESGKWEQRGPRRGQYVMARIGDTGPYQRDNVRICTVGENTVENTSRLAPRGFCGPGYQAKKWRDASPEQQADWKRRQGHMLGKQISKATRRKMSEAHKLRWQRRKAFRW